MLKKKLKKFGRKNLLDGAVEKAAMVTACRLRPPCLWVPLLSLLTLTLLALVIFLTPMTTTKGHR